MELYILRHAKAEERGSPGRDDSKRPLTADGRKKMLAVAQGMLALELEFDCILTSPFARARQTAEIVARVFKTDKLFLCKPLAANGNPRHLIEELNNTFPGCRSALIVGHEPYLSHFGFFAHDGRSKTGHEFQKSGALQTERGGASPGTMRAIGVAVDPGATSFLWPIKFFCLRPSLRSNAKSSLLIWFYRIIVLKQVHSADIIPHTV